MPVPDVRGGPPYDCEWQDSTRLLEGAGPVRCRDGLRPGRGDSIRAVPHNTLTTAPRGGRSASWTRRATRTGSITIDAKTGAVVGKSATVTAGPSYLMTSACERTAAGITRPSAEAVVAFTVR